MPYGEIVSRSWAIIWRHKYLWLLALLASEGAGFSWSSGASGSSTRGNSSTTTGTGAADWNTVTTWTGAHVALLVTLGLLALALVLAFFLLSVVANGAIVKASYEYDAGRPYAFAQAWRAGVANFWPVLKVKLIAAVVALAAVVVIAALAGATAYLAVIGAVAGAVVVGLLAAALVLVAIPCSIAFGVLILLAVRGVVVDNRSASTAFSYGFAMFQRRLGRTALAWLLSVGLNLLGGVILGICAFVVALPLAGITAAAYYAMGIPGAIGVGSVLAAVWLGLLLTGSGALSAFISTYWTLTYTRLDRDPQPMLQAQTPPPAAA